MRDRSICCARAGAMKKVGQGEPRARLPTAVQSICRVPTPIYGGELSSRARPPARACTAAALHDAVRSSDDRIMGKLNLTPVLCTRPLIRLELGLCLAKHTPNILDLEKSIEKTALDCRLF